uniref:Uncharacterized protein n=1 Tax=Strigamia maritima TaxID=126957 RepID=T1JCN9_STRMM
MPYSGLINSRWSEDIHKQDLTHSPSFAGDVSFCLAWSKSRVSGATQNMGRGECPQSCGRVKVQTLYKIYVRYQYSEKSKNPINISYYDCSTLNFHKIIHLILLSYFWLD